MGNLSAVSEPWKQELEKEKAEHSLTTAQLDVALEQLRAYADLERRRHIDVHTPEFMWNKIATRIWWAAWGMAGGMMFMRWWLA